MPRPPLPPFTRETAVEKVRLAEDAWNTRDPEKVAAAYTPDSQWRNRAEFLTGRQAIQEFLARKWARELDYRLIKGVVGLRRRSHRRPVRLRMARRLGHVVPFLRERELGVRRPRADATAVRQHQRPAHRRVRPPVRLAAGPPSRRSSRARRPGSLSGGMGLRRVGRPPARPAPTSPAAES